MNLSQKRDCQRRFSKAKIHVPTILRLFLCWMGVSVVFFIFLTIGLTVIGRILKRFASLSFFRGVAYTTRDLLLLVWGESVTTIELIHPAQLIPFIYCGIYIYIYIFYSLWIILMCSCYKLFSPLPQNWLSSHAYVSLKLSLTLTVFFVLKNTTVWIVSQTELVWHGIISESGKDWRRDVRGGVQGKEQSHGRDCCPQENQTRHVSGVWQKISWLPKCR